MDWVKSRRLLEMMCTWGRSNEIMLRWVLDTACTHVGWQKPPSVGALGSEMKSSVSQPDLASHQAPDEKELMSKQTNSLKLSDYTWKKKTGSLLAEMSLY